MGMREEDWDWRKKGGVGHHPKPKEVGSRK